MSQWENIHADVVIIGSGAGGATVFERLTARGLDVLMIEEGSPVTPEILAVPIPQRIQSLYRNAGLSPILGLPPIAYGEGKALGGTTEINGGLLWKTPPKILDDWMRRGLFPGQSLDDIDREFERIQRDLNVHPTTNIPGFDRASDLLHDGAQELGWSSVAAQRAVKNCQRINQCGAGCPTGAKQAMSQTYIPRGIAQGGRILTNTKAIRLIASGRNSIESVECIQPGTKKRIRIYARDFFLAAGTMHSPALLSTLSRGFQSFPFGLHLNAKIVAEFPQEINGENATIFSQQVQTFMDEGIIMMATNFGPEFLSLTTSTADPATIRHLSERFNHLGLYTVQTRPQGQGRLLGASGKLIPTFQLNKPDSHQIMDGVKKLSAALFAAGAQLLWLPLKGFPSATSTNDVEVTLQKSKSADWQLSTVHVMSSLGIGPGIDSKFNVSGKHKKLKNLYIADASALPTSVGESPQGSIMAVASNISESYLSG